MDARRAPTDHRPEGQPTERPPVAAGLRRMLFLLLAAAVLLFLVRSPGDTGWGAVIPRVTWSAFLELVDAGDVARVTLQGQDVRGSLRDEQTLRTATGDTVRHRLFQTVAPHGATPELVPVLVARGVEVEARPESRALSWILIMFLPLLLLLGVWLYAIRRMRGPGEGILTMGKSGAHVYDGRREKTTFDDVAGASGAKQELREIIEFLRDPERFRRLGAEIPRGVLLVGPPGTGKTLLARAVAGEAGVPFFSITGSAFMEMFVGVGPKRVRDLFENAKAAAPSIVFIDELDAIGGRRGAGVIVGGADERERTLNQLLSEMSGFEPAEDVIVMAATNRPDVLDPALLRPGRFDRSVVVDLPTSDDRASILRLHARNKPLDPGVDLDAVARSTPGFSGADLKNLLNEAAILAARRGADRIGPNHIDDARDKVMLGLEREGLALTDHELRLLAYHEAGHAVLAAVLPHADPLHKVTIVPRGRSMGVTQQLPERDRYIYDREYLVERLAVMMGGRAAESLVFETATSGAENDLRQAGALARRMVLDWGMSEALGPMVAEHPSEDAYLGSPSFAPRQFSEETSRRVDQAVRELLEGAYAQALSTLRERRDALERVAARLREVEALDGSDVLALVECPAVDGRKPGTGVGVEPVSWAHPN